MGESGGSRSHSTFTGAIVPGGTYLLTFRLYNQAAGGTAIWTEAQDIPVKSGILYAELGAVALIPDTISFNDNDFWLGIQAGSDAGMTPRQHNSTSPATLSEGDWSGVRSKARQTRCGRARLPARAAPHRAPNHP
jgi:hypothetical protein